MSQPLENGSKRLGFLVPQPFNRLGIAVKAGPSFGGRYGQLIVFTFLAAILLSPPIVLFRDSPWFRLEQPLLVVVGYLYLLGIMFRRVPRPRLCYFHVWGVLFSISIFVSIVYGAAFLRIEVVRPDYYEVLKVWLTVALFTLGYEARLGEAALRGFITVLGWCTFAVCLFAVGQYVGLPWAESLSFYFSTAEHNIHTMTVARRVFSTFGNANDLGEFLSAAQICFTLAFLARVGRRLWTGPLALFVVFCMILSGSRYALLALALGLLLLMLGAMTDPRHLMKTASAIILIGIVVWTLLGTSAGPSVHIERYQQLRHFQEVDSLRARFDVLWGEPWDQFRSSPILGLGPAKHILTGSIIDSEDLEILRRYGLLGFTAYISIFLWILLKLKRGLRFTPGLIPSRGSPLRATMMLVQAGFILLVMDLFMNVGMGTYTSFQFGGFFWVFMGAAVRSAKFLEEVPA